MSVSNITSATQRLTDILMAKKTGHQRRPSFVDWELPVVESDSLAQRRTALVAHQERLTALRIEAKATWGMLSKMNYDILGQMIQDAVRQLRILKAEEQSARDLNDHIAQAYQDQVGPRNWQIIIDRAYALQQLDRGVAEEKTASAQARPRQG